MLNNNKIEKMLYRSIYLILHWIYALCKSVISVYSNLKTTVFSVLPDKNGKKFPNTIPKHLTILLGYEEPSKNDLVNLILWCLAARIPFISFYDYKGLLTNQQDELRSLLETKKLKSDHVIWHNEPNFVYKNGYTGRKIHVKIYNRNDGRYSIVNTIKQLSLCNNRNCNLNEIDVMLRKQYEFPDPDLGLCFGRTFCLYGYPPWQIRLTEFLHIDTHCNFQKDRFVDLLQTYSQCEQRYGK